jgi:dipeptidyl-peptidase-4
MRRLSYFLVLFIGFTFSANAQSKKLTIDDAFLKPELNPANLTGLTWIPNTHNFSYIQKDFFIQGNAISAKKDTLITLTQLNQSFQAAKLNTVKKIPAYSWLDANRILFNHHNRWSIYNVKEKTADSLQTLPENADNADYENGKMQVAYTVDNNLFVMQKDGKSQNISNESNVAIVYGQSAHRNEFGINKGTFWSPNGNYLAFYRMDQTMVTDYPLVDISTRPASVNPIKYPMAGDKSHQVTLGVYNVSTKNTLYLKTTGDPEQYLTNISWSPDEKYIYIAVLNRAQNHMWLNKYEVSTGNFVKTLFEETNDKYVEPLDELIFVKNKPEQFLWLSQRDGFKHFYIYNTDGKLLGQLTKGNWLVTSFLGFDQTGKNVFYTSTAESPLEIHPYMVNLKSKKIKRLSKEAGVHGTLVSSDGAYILDNFTNPTTPRKVDVINTGITAVKGGADKVEQTVFAAENPIKDYKLGQTKTFTIKADDGTDLYCRIILPADYDATKKYAVVTYVYGGPHAQMINGGWLNGSNLWMQYMAQQGYIMFTLDNRGSQNRGMKFEQATFRNLGDVEIKDQLKGVEYLRSLSYVDTARMGLHGCSFGGFMTTSMMVKHPGVYKVAVAGGPVIDWKYYEIMYTERYMDTPQENPEGYKNADLTNYVKNLNGRLMLIHGTVDNVVVWQHSLMFVKKCVDEGKMLDYFVYPGHEHNVLGKDRAHLYKKITQYFDDFLK